MLTPSPLRTRTLFTQFGSGNDADDLFLQSPFKSPSIPTYLATPGGTLLSNDDDEGSAFFGSSSAMPFSPIFLHNSGQPLQTPAKQLRRAPSRPVLSAKSVNRPPCQNDGSGATGSPGPGVGTKRKSNAFANNCSTPLRQRVLTPLSISANAEAAKSGGVAFDRLAPLPAPKFSSRTPHSRAETEVHLKKQTRTMTQLSIGDFNDSGVAFGPDDNDSGCEDNGDTLFLDNPSLRPSKTRSTRDYQTYSGSHEREDVAEAISPGGHVTKRRARSRPVSVDLLESVRRTDSPIQNSVSSFYHRYRSYLTNPSWPKSATDPTLPLPSHPFLEAIPEAARNRPLRPPIEVRHSRAIG